MSILYLFYLYGKIGRVLQHFCHDASNPLVSKALPAPAESPCPSRLQSDSSFPCFNWESWCQIDLVSFDFRSYSI